MVDWESNADRQKERQTEGGGGDRNAQYISLYPIPIKEWNKICVANERKLARLKSGLRWKTGWCADKKVLLARGYTALHDFAS